MDLELIFNDYLFLFDISRTQHGFFYLIKKSPRQAERKLEDEALNLSTHSTLKMALVILNQKEIINNTTRSSNYYIIFHMFLPKILSLTRSVFLYHPSENKHSLNLQNQSIVTKTGILWLPSRRLHSFRVEERTIILNR